MILNCSTEGSSAFFDQHFLALCAIVLYTWAMLKGVPFQNMFVIVIYIVLYLCEIEFVGLALRKFYILMRSVLKYVFT